MRDYVIWGLTEEYLNVVETGGLPEGIRSVYDSDGNYLYMETSLSKRQALKVRLEMLKWNLIFGTRFVLLEK